MIKEAKTQKEIEGALNVRYISELKPLGISKKDVKKEDLNDEPINLINVVDGKIVASVTAFLVSEKESALFYLGVLPEFESRGIGKKMVLAMEKLLKNKGIKKNSIVARNHLQKFYSGLGYTPVGKIKKYPGFAEKGIFHRKMVKNL